MSTSSQHGDLLCENVARGQRGRSRSLSLVVTLFACALMMALAWLNTGSRTPYALFNPEPVVTPKCQYLLNIDDLNFRGCFYMLQGMPSVFWEGSVVLRRILYPLLAYPLVKSLGYLLGGFLTSLLVTAVAYWFFVSKLGNAFGDGARISGAMLLATYPGIAYWIGLPYSYAVIVPFSILAYLILESLSPGQRPSCYIWAALGIGTLSTGYDLLPFFGSGLLFLVLLRRIFYLVPLAVLGLVTPQVVSNWILWKFYGISTLNTNTQSIVSIFSSFLSKPDHPAWWALIKNAPEILLHNYIFSNFMVLPILFGMALLLQMIRKRSLRVLRGPESAVLLAALLVFLVNNLAPPYTGWQLRGLWIARLYQPIFVVLIFFIVRVMSDMRGGLRVCYLIVVITGASVNLLISLGPVTEARFTAYVYHNFYMQSSEEAYLTNTIRFPARYLGMCSYEE